MFIVVWRAEGALGGGGAAAGGPSGAEQHRSRRSPRLETRRVRSKQPRPASGWPRAQHQTLLELGSQEISHSPCHRSRGSGADLGLHRAKLEPLFSPGSYLFSLKKKIIMPTPPPPQPVLLPPAHHSFRICGKAASFLFFGLRRCLIHHSAGTPWLSALGGSLDVITLYI